MAGEFAGQGETRGRLSRMTRTAGLPALTPLENFMAMRLIVACALGSSLFVLSGCLVRSSSRTEYSGRYIGAETVRQIEPGKSKEDFVLAVLGSPSSKTQVADGSEVWKWDYRKKHHSRGKVFLIVSADDSSETQGATYVVLRDSVVEKVWQD